MKTRRVLYPLICAMLLLGALPVGAQVRITGSISGTVSDSQDAVIPGATVLLKDEGTGITRDTVTNDSGFFQFPDLNHGTYSITVTLQGFQKAVYNRVVVESGRTTDLRVKLTPGGLEETVTVEAATTPVLETSSNLIANTLNRKELVELPLAGRDAFVYARLVPGAVAPQGTGSTHYNGMPGGVINPTIDGINNSSNGFKSGGTSFFGTVNARLGAVEQVTVESGGVSGDSAVTGGVNLKFVTRRGSSQYRGSAFWQHRNEALNATSYANNRNQEPKDKLRRHDFGGNFGGPLVPKGDMRNKLFIFMNYEHEHIPQTQLRERNVLTDEAAQGIFRYNTSTGESRTVNVLTMAGNAGFPSTINPVIANILAQQKAAQANGDVVETSDTNPRTRELQWLQPQKEIRFFPTARLDYQITPNLSWMGSWNYRGVDAQGWPNWPLPGFPNQNNTFHAAWWITSTGLNWAVNTNTHNEFRFGVQHSGDVVPGAGSRPVYEQLNGIVNGLPARFNFPLGLSPMAADISPITGRHYITTIYDTFTMIRGNHTWKFGGNYRDTQWRDTSYDGPGTAGFLLLPQYTLGVNAQDPVANLFTTANVPGLNTNDQGALQSLYAFLTGRVSNVQTGRVVDPETLQYSDSELVYRENWTSAWFAGLFIQDQWRTTPDLTLNYGLRWEMNQSPYSHLGQHVFPDVANLFGPSTRLFAPGELNGVQNPVMRPGKYAAGADYVNPGPHAGFSWLPRFENNLMGKIFGRGDDTVIRGGYDLTYYDEGTLMFSATAGNNPGVSQSWLSRPNLEFPAGSVTLSSGMPNFTTLPPTFKQEWPMSDFTFGTTSLNTMEEDLKMPWVQAWNISVQRQIMPNTVLELRYTGNKGHNVWHTYPINEVNIFENNFLDEFRRAQNNLAINVANGRTGFANNGLPGQAPLPIFDAAFGARGAQPALGTGQAYTSAAFITNLQNGEAGRMAQSLATNPIYTCRMVGNTLTPCATLNYTAPGPYPINFFVPNPYAINGANAQTRIVDDDARTKYHAMQVQLRRRYAGGTTLNVNYTLGKNWADIWADNANQQHNYRTLRDKDIDWGPAPFDVRHVLQIFGTYDLPFGNNRRWDIGNPVLEAVAGGWTVGGILTAQSGTPFRFISGRQTFNQFDSGVILANGHTKEEIQSMIKVHRNPNSGTTRFYVDPRLIGPDGRANPEYLQVPTTPGELGDFLYLRGVNSWNLNASLNKTTRVVGRTQLTLHMTIQNVFNHPMFGTPGFLGNADITSTTFGQTTNPFNGAREMYFRVDFSF